MHHAPPFGVVCDEFTTDIRPCQRNFLNRFNLQCGLRLLGKSRIFSRRLSFFLFIFINSFLYMDVLPCYNESIKKIGVEVDEKMDGGFFNDLFAGGDTYVRSSCVGGICF